MFSQSQQLKSTNNMNQYAGNKRNEFLKNTDDGKICEFKHTFSHPELEQLKNSPNYHVTVKISNKNDATKIQFEYRLIKCNAIKYYYETNATPHVQSMYHGFCGIFYGRDLKYFINSANGKEITFCSYLYESTIKNVIFHRGSKECVVVLGYNIDANDYFYRMKWTNLVFMYEQHYNMVNESLFERILSDEYLVKKCCRIDFYKNRKTICIK